MENDKNEQVYIPSVWSLEDTEKSPSMCSWASIDDDGNYSHGDKFYDADMNEINTENEEYWLFLAGIDYLTEKEADGLIGHFGGVKEVFELHFCF